MAESSSAAAAPAGSGGGAPAVATAAPPAVPAPRLAGKTVCLLCDFAFEDAEVVFPKLRLEEEGATVHVVGAHPAGMKYTGKYGYPVKSTHAIDGYDAAGADAIVIPGGFAPDYMRRSKPMLAAIAAALARPGGVVAAICHGPWMLCSARDEAGTPVVCGRQCTSFVAIRDDVENAGGVWRDEAVVVDDGPGGRRASGRLITSRTPNDLTRFCQAIIASVEEAR